MRQALREGVAGAALTRRRLLRSGLAGGLAAIASRSVADETGGGARTLYVLSASQVLAFEPGAEAPRVLVERPGGARPGVYDGVAIDAPRGHIYWTDMGRAAAPDGAVWRCDLDGRNPVCVVEEGKTHTPKQLSLAGAHLYWSDREGMAVMRAALDRSGIETLVRTGDPVRHAGEAHRWCVGVAVDPERGHLYWTQKGGDNAGRGVIRRAGLEPPPGEPPGDRSDVETLFAGLPEPIDLDFDPRTRLLYWADRGDNTVSRAPMDPPAGFDPAARDDREILVRGLREAIGVALDTANERLAYTSLGGEVGLARLDGSDARLLVSDYGQLLTGAAWGA